MDKYLTTEEEYNQSIVHQVLQDYPQIAKEKAFFGNQIDHRPKPTSAFKYLSKIMIDELNSAKKDWEAQLDTPIRTFNINRCNDIIHIINRMHDQFYEHPVFPTFQYNKTIAALDTWQVITELDALYTEKQRIIAAGRTLQQRLASYIPHESDTKLKNEILSLGGLSDDINALYYKICTPTGVARIPEQPAVSAQQVDSTTALRKADGVLQSIADSCPLLPTVDSTLAQLATQEAGSQEKRKNDSRSWWPFGR